MNSNCPYDCNFCLLYNNDHKKCKALQEALVSEYHKVDKKIFNVNDYSTELVQRLNYEIIFGYLDKNTIINSTFLINDDINCKRDEGHQHFILYLCNTLLLYNINEISSVNIKKAIYLHDKYILEKELKYKNSYEYILAETIKELAENDAYKSFLFVVNNNEDYDSINGWKYYNEPIFNNKGIIDIAIIDKYKLLYNYSYNKYFDDYEY